MELNTPNYLHVTGSWNRTICGDNMRCTSEDGQTVRTWDVVGTKDGGLRIDPMGSMEVMTGGARDPAMRGTLSGMFNVVVAPASELAGQLFCAVTGKKIAVSRIVDNPVLWCDKEHGLAMYPYGVRYASEAAVPVPREKSDISYSFANQKNWKAQKPRIDRIVAEGKARAGLLGVTGGMGFNLQPPLAALLVKPETEDFMSWAGRHTDEGVERLMVWCVRYGVQQMEHLKGLCDDHYKAQTLVFKP